MSRYITLTKTFGSLVHVNMANVSHYSDYSSENEKCSRVVTVSGVIFDVKEDCETIRLKELGLFLND